MLYLVLETIFTKPDLVHFLIFFIHGPKLFFISVFLFSIDFCFGQSDYRAGFIINLSNDTIPGYINNKGNLKTLKKCRFKDEVDSDYTDYSPEEIHGFRIYEGSYYVSMEIEKEGKKERYFIEKLVEGIIDVYYYSELNDGYYLMQTEDGEMYELKNSKIQVTNDEGSFEKDKKEYVYVLRYLLQDSPKSIQKVDYLGFDTNSIINLAQDYHNDVCDDYECIVYTKERIKPKLKFGIHVGYSVSSITVFDNEYTKNLNKDYSGSQDIVYGLFFNYMDPNISNRFSLQLDALYQQGKYIADESSMEITYFKIPFSLKYSLAHKRVVPSLWLGMAYNMWIDFEDKNIVPEHLSGDAIQKDKHQFGLYTGLELSYNLNDKIAIFFQGKYEWYKGKHTNLWIVPALSVGDYLSSKTSFISFSTGLRF